MSTEIIYQGTTLEALFERISSDNKKEIAELKKELLNKKANDELLTRKQTCEYLHIDSSTCWHWTNKGKIKAYGIANRRYYKRSELMSSLIELNPKRLEK